jgi:hypothetical protein
MNTVSSLGLRLEWIGSIKKINHLNKAEFIFLVFPNLMQSEFYFFYHNYNQKMQRMAKKRVASLLFQSHQAMT